MGDALLVQPGVVVLAPPLLLRAQINCLLLLLPAKLLYAALDERDLDVRLCGLALLHEVGTSLPLDGMTEVIHKLLNDCVLRVRPVRGNLQVVPSAGNVTTEHNEALLRLAEGMLEDLHLGDCADDLVQHLLSLSAVVVLLLDNCLHVCLQRADCFVPILRTLGQVLQRTQGNHQDVTLAEHHHVLRDVGHALGIRPAALWQKGDGRGNRALQLLRDNAQLPLGEELVEEFVLAVVKFTQADLLQLRIENSKFRILDVLFQGIITEVGLVHAG
mmetsp:Transcript_78469/g.233771  ORF Transcript_78469/g.233771 Transcript_78469/m.233771 type:complete len:273 (+) Transcript_78469:1786-2604(+)